jgi:endonuclease III
MESHRKDTWSRLSRSKRAWQEKLHWVDALLEETHHTPDLGNVENPLDELIYILLTKKTPPERYRPVFTELCERFKPWNKLLECSSDAVAQVLKPLGLSLQRAVQIRQIAVRINEDVGQLSLDHLKLETCDRARRYLLSLPGVGEKSARCVLMYAMNCDISPMDVHATRVMVRLGLLPRLCSQAQAHTEVDLRLPSGAAKRLHVNLVAHGRTYCTSRNPRCRDCPLLERCRFGLFRVG